MSNRQSQMMERVARQTHIDETCVEPEWTKKVDTPLLEQCFASPMPTVPVVLMPELRFKSLLQQLADCFPRVGKVMIVDDTNTRFDSLRRSVPKTGLSLYFSAQELSALNYANDIFHYTITEIGIASLLRLEVILAAYRRVLRPDGHLLAAVPIQGSFDAFFDLLEECLVRISPNNRAEVMDEIRQAMTLESITQIVKDSGFEIENSKIVDFDLTFPNVEQLLFSTLVESHYLGLCMSWSRPDIDSRALLTLLVRSFHHYFQGESLRIPIKSALLNAAKIRP